MHREKQMLGKQRKRRGRYRKSLKKGQDRIKVKAIVVAKRIWKAIFHTFLFLGVFFNIGEMDE